MCGACNVSTNQELKQAAPTLAKCEQMAKQVGLPPIQEGADLRVIAARYRAALVSANKNLGDTSQCLALIDQFENEDGAGH
jgi:hypothetical protein